MKVFSVLDRVRSEAFTVLHWRAGNRYPPRPRAGLLHALVLGAQDLPERVLAVREGPQPDLLRDLFRSRLDPSAPGPPPQATQSGRATDAVAWGPLRYSTQTGFELGRFKAQNMWTTRCLVVGYAPPWFSCERLRHGALRGPCAACCGRSGPRPPSGSPPRPRTRAARTPPPS